MGAGLGGLGYGSLIEPRWLQLAIQPLPAGRRGSTPVASLAQISDLHLKGIGEQHSKIAEEFRRRSPDLVVITGDSIDSPGAVPMLEEFLSLLPYAIAKYAILGNWEYWGGVDVNRLGAAYERANGTLLVNRSVEHGTSAGTVRISGLDDLVGGTPDPEAVLGEADGPGEADLHLLLAHCPAQRDLVRWGSGSVDLMLSGHTHGGQVQIFGYAPWVPRGSGRYLQGWYEEAGPPMYVCRGVGTSVLPVRFGARPEVTFFESAGQAGPGRPPVTSP